MVILIGSHGLSDFDAWVDLGKKSMADPDRRKQFGITESHVYRTADGDRGIVIHQFNTLEQAQQYQAMMDTPEGHARLEQNGATPPYAFWIAEEVEL